MSDTAWPDGYRQDAWRLAGMLALVLAIAFAPYLFGNQTLLTSAADAPSLYPAGAAPMQFAIGPLKETDPGGGAWQGEAWLQIEHDALFADHRVPWWDPYDGYGTPFAAAQQPQPFFPLTALASIHPSPRVWNWYVVARFFVAGFFGALFVRLYGGRIAALAGGIACALAGYYILFYPMPHISAEAMLPALLWATEWAVRRPGAASAAGVASAAAALHLGGMPESSLICVLFAALYLAARTLFTAPMRLTLARCAAFGAGNVMGAAVGGVMIVPLLEFLGNGLDMHRVAGTFPGLVAETIPAWKAVLLHLAPLAFGPPLNALDDAGGAMAWSGLRGWFGTAAAFCGLVAVFALPQLRRERNPAAGPVAALAVVGTCAFAKCLGAGWINWIGVLPGLRYVLFVKYAEPVVDVSAALLCGLGIALFENGRRPDRWVPLAAAAIVAVALSYGLSGALHEIPPSQRETLLFGAMAFAAALLCTGTLATASQMLPPKRIALVLAVTVGVDAVANYYAPMFGAIGRSAPIARDPYIAPPFVQALRTLDRDGLRVAGKGGPLWPNWAGAMRLDDPEGQNALYPRRYLPFVAAFLRPVSTADPSDLHDRVTLQSNPLLTTPVAKRWLTLSSVGFVVVPVTDRIADPSMRFLRDDGTVRIYAYADPLPRASVFHDIRAVADPEDALRALKDQSLDPRRTLVLAFESRADAAANASGTTGAGPAGAESARIVARDVSTVTIDARLARAGFVMLTDTNYPGWTATVDGTATPVLDADYLFRAVRVGPGRHVVRFEYASRAVAAGLFVSLLGLLAVAGCAAFALRRAPLRRDAGPPVVTA